MNGSEGKHMTIVVLTEVAANATIGRVHVASVAKTVLGTRPKAGNRNASNTKARIFRFYERQN